MVAVIVRLTAARCRTAFACAAALALAPTPIRGDEPPPATILEFRRLSVEEPRECQQRGEQLLATAYAAAHPEWAREVMYRMARAATLLSETERIEALAARLEALGRDRGDVVADAYARFTRAAVAADSGRTEEAVGAATGASERLAASGDPTLLAVAAGELCDVLARASRVELGKPNCEVARSRWLKIGDQFQIARTENYLSMIAQNERRLDDAIRLGESARTRFLRAGMPSMATMMDDNLSGIYLDKGDAARALALSSGSLARELATGKVLHAVLSRMNIARAYSLLGEHVKALESIATAVADAERVHYDVALPEVYGVQVAVAQAAGKPDLAVAAAQARADVVQRLASQEAERSIAEMEARYQAKEKQRQIDELGQANRINALELERAAERLRREKLSLALVAVAGASLAIVASLLVLLLRAGRRRERELAVLSGTDALTGTASRRAFMQALSAVFAAVRERGGDAALWVIDADHFKCVNDQHGHPAGDEVLKELVARVRLNIRASDTLGRLGGEEFGLVLPGVTAEEAMQRAEKVRGAIASAPVAVGETGVAVTVSIGVAMLDRARHDSFERWLAAADAALYAAKSAGRNRAVLCAQ